MKSFLFALPVLILALSSNVTGWIGVVAALGGLIFVHELGHFLVAKRMGMPVEVFSLGFGPRLVGFKWRETDVRLSALPLGGYVKLLGFNPEDPDAEDPYGFQHQPIWKRQLFFAGGIIFNVLTAFVADPVALDRSTAASPVAAPFAAPDSGPAWPPIMPLAEPFAAACVLASAAASRAV